MPSTLRSWAGLQLRGTGGCTFATTSLIVIVVMVVIVVVIAIVVVVVVIVVLVQTRKEALNDFKVAAS